MLPTDDIRREVNRQLWRVFGWLGLVGALLGAAYVVIFTFTREIGRHQVFNDLGTALDDRDRECSKPTDSWTTDDTAAQHWVPVVSDECRSLRGRAEEAKIAVARFMQDNY